MLKTPSLPLQVKQNIGLKCQITLKLQGGVLLETNQDQTLIHDGSNKKKT